MKKRECPSCAMEVAADSTECPVCGYEFPRYKPVARWVYVLFVLVLLVVVYMRLRPHR